MSSQVTVCDRIDALGISFAAAALSSAFSADIRWVLLSFSSHSARKSLPAPAQVPTERRKASPMKKLSPRLFAALTAVSTLMSAGAAAKSGW